MTFKGLCTRFATATVLTAGISASAFAANSLQCQAALEGSDAVLRMSIKIQSEQERLNDRCPRITKILQNAAARGDTWQIETFAGDVQKCNTRPSAQTIQATQFSLDRKRQEHRTQIRATCF